MIMLRPAFVVGCCGWVVGCGCVWCGRWCVVVGRGRSSGAGSIRGARGRWCGRSSLFV